MNKEAVVENFSRYASSYDHNADVQGEAAAMLARILPKNGIKKILDIGCGTGNYTAILKNIFVEANIMAMDVSEQMIEAARRKIAGGKVTFKAGDAETEDLGGGYDLITSNAAFHWFDDPAGMIKRVKDALGTDGVFIFSSFGPKTFLELKASLDFTIGKEISIASALFPAKAELEKALRGYFNTVNIKERLIRESYASVHELLKKIKYSGTRGKGSNARQVWSRALLKKIEGEYLKRFGSVEATYQVFFCEAKE